MDKTKIANLENDIQAIDSILSNNLIFDRERALKIISNYKIQDGKIVERYFYENIVSDEIIKMTNKQLKERLFDMSMILRKEVSDELTDGRK